MATPLKRSQNSLAYAAQPYPHRKNNVVRHKFNPQRIKKRKKQNPLKGLITLIFLGLFGYYVVPHIFVHFFEPMFLNRILNKNIKADMSIYVNPTRNYISNSTLLGQNLLTPTAKKTKKTGAKMSQIVTSGENLALKTELNGLIAAYPHLKPSIYVWDYTTGKSVEINSNKPVSTASIIKIPILIELFRQIEENEKLSKEEKSVLGGGLKVNSSVVLSEVYKTSGSGELQYGQFGRKTSINNLANLMIINSDNTATNAILDYIGGKDGLNRAFRQWGMENSYIGDWLPDLIGQNRMSAKDVSTILYNLDNPTFLNSHSKEYIKEYMVNVKNTTLLKAGLPRDATIYHKTGDIGRMLGDAGIIYNENGKKYIVTILVQRGQNDYSARDFIQSASRIIYKRLL